VAVANAVVGGLLIGGVYALISVGLTLIFGVMDMINFAQGQFLMVGMFLAYVASARFGVDPLVAAVGVGAIVFVGGCVVERLVIEPIIRAPQMAQVFATIGLGLVLQNAAALLFGPNNHSVSTPYQNQTLHLGPIGLTETYLFAFVVAGIFTALLFSFLTLTSWGRAMRATAQNRQAALLVGINPRLMAMLAFGIGVGLTALAGAVVLPYTIVNPTAGQGYVLIMFTVVVLGGLGSVRGALLAGLAIGVIQSLSTVFLPVELENLAVFLIFLAALVVVPGGVARAVRERAVRMVGARGG
jgi:branched-chain amino acid transport system permease protein